MTSRTAREVIGLDAAWRPRSATVVVVLSILGGLCATAIIPRFVSWIPYDYSVYMQGARMVRGGLDPYAFLPYWYPLPIVLFTTLPWSFLPDTFAWAFAFIPLGLLHLRFGRNTALCWLFFPLLINVAYAQAEGWLILPLAWLLDDVPGKSQWSMAALLFKPAYGLFLIPYRIWHWVQDRRSRDLITTSTIFAVMFLPAFFVDPQWVQHWIAAILRRGDNPELILRNMTVWAFVGKGGLWLIPMALLVASLALLSVWLWSDRTARGTVLVSAALFFFPGLNPVSSMMVLSFLRTREEIITIVVVSWLIAALEVLIDGFGGLYLAIVLAALVLRTRQTYRPRAEHAI